MREGVTNKHLYNPWHALALVLFPGFTHRGKLVVIFSSDWNDYRFFDSLLNKRDDSTHVEYSRGGVQFSTFRTMNGFLPSFLPTTKSNINSYLSLFRRLCTSRLSSSLASVKSSSSRCILRFAEFSRVFSSSASSTARFKVFTRAFTFSICKSTSPRNKN